MIARLVYSIRHLSTWWALVGPADAWIVAALEFLLSHPSTHTLRINIQTVNNSCQQAVLKIIIKFLRAWSKKCNLHLSLRSSIAPSSGRSHLSHRNVCTSDCVSASPSFATLRTSTKAQCQARFGKPGRISRRSRIISRCPSVALDLSRTWRVCIDQGKQCC